MSKTGVLLINTGTPDTPTPKAVRRYLREFLSDRRVVQVPRIIWLPLLYGVILSLRPRRSAKFYQKIWAADGSPLRLNMEKIAASLKERLNCDNTSSEFFIEIGMNYGQPSIAHALEKLHNQQVDQIIVLPFFPQFSNTTTASSFDRVKKHAEQYLDVPEICFIQDYAEHPNYINALASSIRESWSRVGKAKHLLISFHGIPESFVRHGDPYRERCIATSRSLAEKLQLHEDKWTLCFQSRFGYAKWLLPSTQDLLQKLPHKGIKQIDVVCPGFPVDCLETLEEIAIRGKEAFIKAGGESLNYISALNNSESHIDTLLQIIKKPHTSNYLAKELCRVD